MAFAPLYNKLNELELKVNSIPKEYMTPIVTPEPVDLTPINSKILAIEEKLAQPTPEYATAESVSVLIDKYNQVTNVLTQFNMQLSSIVERINALESK